MENIRDDAKWQYKMQTAWPNCDDNVHIILFKLFSDNYDINVALVYISIHNDSTRSKHRYYM